MFSLRALRYVLCSRDLAWPGMSVIKEPAVMLFHGREAPIEKKFARGLECMDRAASARSVHSKLRAKFFSIRTDLGREITSIYFFAVVYEWKMYEEQTCKPRMLLLWRDVCKKASGIPFKCTDECQKLSMSYQIWRVPRCLQYPC